LTTPPARQRPYKVDMGRESPRYAQLAATANQIAGRIVKKRLARQYPGRCSAGGHPIQEISVCNGLRQPAQADALLPVLVGCERVLVHPH